MNPPKYELKSQGLFSQVWDRGSVGLVFLREDDPLPVLFQVYERPVSHGSPDVINKLTGLCPPRDLNVIFCLLEGAHIRDPLQLDLARKKWAALDAKIVAGVAAASSFSRSAGTAAATSLFDPKKEPRPQVAGPSAKPATAVGKPPAK